MHKLIIEDDEGKEVVFPLIRGEISIGRQATNLICLTERNVSRRHARLVRKNGHYVLEDLSSYGGTRVNGERIQSPTPLDDGDEVLIGDYRLAMAVNRPLTSMGIGPPPDATGTPAAKEAASMETNKTPPPPLGTGTGEVEPTPSPPARLVAVSSPFMGQEFVLDGETLIIGRTPDNNIVLPHKSISRHHAKVLRDGQRYVVVDLQSGNGIKVNGADYRRVELKSGDVVALGRVRLRFVAAGERAVFERHRFGFGGTPGKVALGVAAAGALAAALLAARVNEKKPASTPALPADLEQQSGAAIEALERSFEHQDYAGLLKAVANLGETTVRDDRARILAQAARSKLVEQHLAAAERHRMEGNCGAVRKEAEAALALESYNQAAQALIARCSSRSGSTPAISAAWRPAAPPAPPRDRAAPAKDRLPPHDRVLAHERTPAPPRDQRPVRRKADGLAPAEVAPAAPADIPLGPPPDKPRRRAIDSDDPYAKDRL
jgi:pSer/pThr/pTyr-binding forkhead associated (FHA) protein